MLTTVLLVFAAMMTAVLCLYGASYVLVAGRFAVLRTRASAGGLAPAGKSSVTVLVPSYNEGEAVIDTVESLLGQEYSEQIVVEVLIKDRSDTSYKPLKRRFGLDKRQEHRREGRRLRVVFTGLRRKNDKINHALKSVRSTYVAFLDADHRADPRWIASSVEALRAKKVDGVQSVRRPLDARKLFQFWDSAQNHLGNEVLNHVFDRLGLHVFFTGTTCLFKTSVFRDEAFPESITEDTYLSYRLICQGKRIAYGGSCGSYEDVAPDLNSYLSRRRRWSSGHNQTFFAHLPVLLTKRGLGTFRRLQLLMHGAYFLLPTLIVVSVNVVQNRADRSFARGRASPAQGARCEHNSALPRADQGDPAAGGGTRPHARRSAERINMDERRHGQKGVGPPSLLPLPGSDRGHGG